jgi:hypothetical protein
MADDRPVKRRVPLRRRTPITRRLWPAAPVAVMPLVPASDAQREKVSGAACIVCERTPVDPAHLVPQRLGGCDHPDCLLALCRSHHRQYDHGQLKLAPYVVDGCERELRHAKEHVSAAVLATWPEPGQVARYASAFAQVADGTRTAPPPRRGTRRRG